MLTSLTKGLEVRLLKKKKEVAELQRVLKDLPEFFYSVQKDIELVSGGFDVTFWEKDGRFFAALDCNFLPVAQKGDGYEHLSDILLRTKECKQSLQELVKHLFRTGWRLKCLDPSGGWRKTGTGDDEWEWHSNGTLVKEMP